MTGSIHKFEEISSLIYLHLLISDLFELWSATKRKKALTHIWSKVYRCLNLQRKSREQILSLRHFFSKLSSYQARRVSIKMCPSRCLSFKHKHNFLKLRTLLLQFERIISSKPTQNRDTYLGLWKTDTFIDIPNRSHQLELLNRDTFLDTLDSSH